jgi:hypothetical protein
MKISIAALLVFILSSCHTESQRTLENILNSSFRVYQISGHQGPKINLAQDSLAQFLIALHSHIPLSEIEKALKWNDETTEKNINLLLKNKLLTPKENDYQPNLGILTIRRGNLLKEASRNIAGEIADSIVNRLPQLKKLHAETDISRQHDFRELSFFYLSNVLLDNYQIRRVEKEFLKKDRPLRNGSHYYLAIVEKTPDQTTEPFGIYGNQGLFWNDSTGICVYGNTRTESNIGWRNYRDKEIFAFDQHDMPLITQKMPEVFFPCLLHILNRNKAYFETTYHRLHFDSEISFEEFFIWWYHFIYTETTNTLVSRKIIVKPEKGLFYYQVNF